MSGDSKPIIIPSIDTNQGLYSSNKGWGYMNLQINIKSYHKVTIDYFEKTNTGSRYYPESASIRGVDSNNTKTYLFNYEQTTSGGYKSSILE